MKYYLTMSIFLFILLFSNMSYSEEINAGSVADAIHDQAKFWGGLINAKLQSDKMNKARIKVEQTIPTGQSRKYDIVVKGNAFIAFMESDKPQLRPGGARTGAVVVLKGTGPAK